jgi:tRNA/rRNA methyltransferase
MIQPEINTSLFHQLRFILVETSHPGNIGGVARAMKTMGFGELVLINPRFPDALTNSDAVAFASGAQDILNQARIVGSFEEAVQGCHFAAAISARLREFSPPVQSPRDFAQQWTQPGMGLPAAIVFGNERYGLPNEIVEKCNILISIPANPDYSSLNLAQAVQVLAYECRVAALGSQIVSGIGFQGERASVAQIDGMFEHLQAGLVAIDFLDAENPKKLMPRLKRLFARSQLELEEVNILRGIARRMMEAKTPSKND